MNEERKIFRAMAIRDEKIIGLSEDEYGLGDIALQDFNQIEMTDLVLLPGLIDSHCHLLQASYAAFDVQIDQAKNLKQLIELIGERALSTPDGEWIRTSAAWHEMNLEEKRFPTAKELDEATTKHPVLVKRGGHNDVVNSFALKIAGISRDTPDPPGGTIVRDESGEPTGVLVQSAAQQLVEKFFQPAPLEKQKEGLRIASLECAAHGITTLRDPAVSNSEMLLYQAVWENGTFRARKADDTRLSEEPFRSKKQPWTDGESGAGSAIIC